MVRKLQMQFLEIEIVFLLKTERQINRKSDFNAADFLGIIKLLEKKKTAT